MRPTLRFERDLLRRGHSTVAGIDEVGRGAIAGPVAVGVVVIDGRTRTAPKGLRDSKLLSPAQRQSLDPRLRRWSLEHAVGSSGPDEIDRWGLITALRLAALRALEQVGSIGAVILDGSHDWLTAPAQSELDLGPAIPWPRVSVPIVHRVVKGDRSCSTVAAASVIAKVTRDAEMGELAVRDRRYGWDVNKGYSTADHNAAIRRWGLCEQHRRSWTVASAASVDLSEFHSPPSQTVVPS